MVFAHTLMPLITILPAFISWVCQFRYPNTTFMIDCNDFACRIGGLRGFPSVFLYSVPGVRCESGNIFEASLIRTHDIKAMWLGQRSTVAVDQF